MMRTFGIWFFGLIASAMIGILAGNWLTYEGGIIGGPAAMATFACLRLWFGPVTK